MPPSDSAERESAKVVGTIGQAGASFTAIDPDTDDSQAGSLATSHPGASEELAAALRETGDAVNTIIDQAEAVLAHDPEDTLSYRAAVQGAMLRILEVCSFEDLTGQRIAKAADFLRRIEMSSSPTRPPAETAQPTPEPNPLLDGPALNAPHMSQREIDAVFSA